MSAVSLPIAWRGLNAGSCAPLPRLVYPQPRLASCHLRECRFYQAGRLDRPRRPPSVQSPFAQLGCYLRWGDVIRLLRGHYSSVFARTGSCAAPVGLSPPSAFELVWRVLAGCYQSLLPTAASRRYLQQSVLGCWIPYPGGTPCARSCFFHGAIGLPQRKSGSASRSNPLETTSCGGFFEVADISLCSGLQVCSPPRSSLPLRILPQGSRGFYVRAERGSLPPRGRVGGWRAGLGRSLYSLLPRPFGCEVSQHRDRAYVSSLRHVERSVWISLTTLTCLLRITGYGTYPAGATFGGGRRTL